MTVAIAPSGSGNLTADGTEQTVFSTATAGTYQAAINLANMASGDSTQIRVYGKSYGSDTETLIYDWTFSNVQGTPLKVFPPEAATDDFKVTLKQIAGTNRTYRWGVRLLG